MDTSTLPQRKVGPFSVSAIGLGCMNLSHAYGNPPSAEEGAAVLQKALELGINFFDTAALYGFGKNEKLVGDVLSSRRNEFVLTSKCGMTGVDGKRVIDGRPATIRATCEQSLKNLKTDVIDLYYLHRWDKTIPVAESVGEMGRLIDEGKVQTIGLSEVGAETILKAHAERAITAVQTEYSPWTRNAEIAVLDTCEKIGAAFVAFSPVARGFLTGSLRDVSTLVEKDIRRGMPRFQGDNFEANLKLLDPFSEIAEEAGCTMAQLCLAWLLAKGEHIVPIPGTTSVEHLADDVKATKLSLDASIIARVDETVNNDTVTGPRYPEGTQAEIDTEEF